MARYTCERCGEMLNTLMPPHLCKDVAGREKRRQKKVDAVVKILEREHITGDHAKIVARAIVNKLSQFGVHPED